MITQEELLKLLNNPDAETDRIEFTVTTDNTDKFCQAICAFSNDYPNHRKAGYLIIGVDKNGRIEKGFKVTDKLQIDIASYRNNGQILPQPSLSLEKFGFEEGEILVVEVLPAFHPPVCYKGVTYIRTGASKAIANEQQERILSEKRTAQARTFDALPCWEAELKDLATDIIKLSYLPLAINSDILEANHRDFKQQLASLRLYDLKHDKPTNAAILLFGLNTSYYFGGGYIEYIKINETVPVLDKIINNPIPFKGALFDLLKEIDNFINRVIIKSKPVRISGSFRDEIVHNYLYSALREFVMNAIMHRDYQSNSPIYIYEFTDRIEIHNAGYLYGEVTKENFPYASDYRNPIIAEAMKRLGYVNKFNFGIQDAQKKLKDNHYPIAQFNLDLQTKMVVTLKINPEWQNE